MAKDWFRNEAWNEAISKEFEKRLLRARQKEQYLRIQASTLAKAHPAVAVELLRRYFELPVQIDRAQAYVDCACALTALGRVDEAVQAYESALRREAEFPNVRTQAYLELALLVATASLANTYQRAKELLEEHKSRVAFPVEEFLWHGAYALILAAQGEHVQAKTRARSALDAAERKDSGFRYHATLGLVTEQHRKLLEAVRSIAAGSARTR